MDDIAAARFDYSKLDLPANTVRLRLNSTVVNVSESAATGIEISYVDKSNGAQSSYRVSAGRCILACYNGIIPALCPDLPESQQANLKYGVKCPLLYVNVLIRDGDILNRVGVNSFSCPDSYFDMIATAPLTTMADYSTTIEKGKLLVLFMQNTPSPVREKPEQTARDLYRQGHYKLLGTPFSEFEAEVKQQLHTMFSSYGFDAERDIEAITVNRWSHGYAYDYLQLFDPEWPEGEAPHELGRKSFGKVTIANSDAHAYAYVDGAIDSAWRAVQEQLAIN